MKPVAVDLFCGLGGWTEGLLAEGYRVIGYDIEAHDYGDGKRYPAKLVIQDVLTIHGSQFKDATLIVASPPCQEFSYMAMPWSRAKAIASEYRSGKRDVKKLTALFDACFQIQREAIDAAGHFIPMVVENVRGAQPWVGKARWNFGSYYLWGDIPALMPITMKRRMKSKISCAPRNFSDRIANTPEEAHALHYKMPKEKEKSELGSLCPIAPKAVMEGSASEGFKTSGMNWSDRTLKGQDFTRIAGQQAEGTKVASETGRRTDVGNGTRFTSQDCGIENGVKQGGISGLRENGKGDKWFQEGAARSGSKSKSRKAASAAIAKIPFALASWIARVYRPSKNNLLTNPQT